MNELTGPRPLARRRTGGWNVDTLRGRAAAALAAFPAFARWEAVYREV